MDCQPAVRKFDLRNSVGRRTGWKGVIHFWREIEKEIRGSPISPRSTRKTSSATGSRQRSLHRTSHSPPEEAGRDRIESAPVGRSEPSNNGDNLPNDLSIAISELLSPMNSTGIGVNDQAVVLPAAAPADIGSVTFENHVQRLLP